MKKTYPKAFEKTVDLILAKKPGPERWRLTAAAWLSINRTDPITGQTAQEEFAATVAHCKELKSKQLNEFGTSKKAGSHGISSNGIRSALAMPTDLLVLIEAFDPSVLETKSGLHRLMKAFPEFTIPEKI